MHKVLFLFGLLLYYSANAQKNGQSAEAWYAEGITAMNHGRWSNAFNAFSRAIAENPGYAEAYASRAIVRERSSDNKGALVDYTLSLELLPDQYEVLLGRAALRYQLGYYPLAREDFKKLLKLPAGETNTIFYRRSAHSPGTDKILTAQGDVKSQVFNYLGLIELELNNCKQSILYLDTAISLNNLEPDYFINRALAKQACHEASALNDFNQALILNPDHPIARHNLALEAARQGAYHLAEKQLTETIRLDSLMLDPYLERGYYRMQRKDFTGSLEDYNKAIALAPDDPEIWLNRGVVKEKLNDRKGAYADYSHAIDLQPDFIKAWLNRGNLLASQQRYKEALEDYSIAILYQADYGAAYYNRAIAHQKSHQKTNACADLKEAKRLGITVPEKMMKQFCAGVLE
jgi:tetratricopeptide (TPR) repeat protein